MSPYTLPPGQVQISFSGGRTSAYMLHQIMEANGGLPEDRVEVVFTNTGREFPETLDFVAEVGQRWGAMETQKGRPTDASLFDKRGGWAQLRRFIQRQGDWVFDAEDALCQRDDGECVI